MSFDNTCKYLSETYPDRFATWLFGTTPESIEVLKTELSIEPIRADFVANLPTQQRLLRMREQDPEPLLQNTALLPLAVLCAAEDSAQLLAQVAEEVSRIEEPEQRQVISHCTQLLAGLRFKRDLIRELFSGGIMRESVIYQEILQEGREEGKLAEALAYTMRLLTRRIGTAPELEAQSRELATHELEDLGEALLDFSELADLALWLQARQDSPQD